MTSRLTIGQAKRLRNDFECWQQDYDPKDDKEQYDMFGRGMVAMDMLIAGMYQEPVAYTDERNLGYIDRGRETAYLWGKQNSEASDVALYRHAQQPVVDADDNFYSWFGREWQENYQHNQYTTAAKQMLGVMAESAWKAGHRAAMLQAGNCRENANSSTNNCREIAETSTSSPVIGIDPASGPDCSVEVRYVAPPGYVMVPKEPTKEMINAGWLYYMATKNPSSKGTYKAMLEVAPQEVRKSNVIGTYQGADGKEHEIIYLSSSQKELK